MRIINAHQNNLRNITLNIPGNQLIVVTGLSGSGKSSLAMDVIANEGYRYFLESLPAYNQQNAQLIPTAEVDNITENNVKHNNQPRIVHRQFQIIVENIDQILEGKTECRINDNYKW